MVYVASNSRVTPSGSLFTVFDTNACPLARGKQNYALGKKCVSCTGCPFGQVVKDNTSRWDKNKIQQLQQNNLIPFLKFQSGKHSRRMKNKYSDGSLRRYIEYFVFRHVFLHEQVFTRKFVPSPLTYLPRTTKFQTNFNASESVKNSSLQPNKQRKAPRS